MYPVFRKVDDTPFVRARTAGPFVSSVPPRNIFHQHSLLFLTFTTIVALCCCFPVAAQDNAILTIDNAGTSWSYYSLFPLRNVTLRCQPPAAPSAIRVYGVQFRNVTVQISCNVGAGGIEVIATTTDVAAAYQPTNASAAAIAGFTLSVRNVTIRGPIRIAAVGPIIGAQLIVSNSTVNISSCSEALGVAMLPSGFSDRFSVSAVGVASESLINTTRIDVDNSTIACGFVGGSVVDDGQPFVARSAFGGLVGMAAPAANVVAVALTASRVEAAAAVRVQSAVAVGGVGVALGRLSAAVFNWSSSGNVARPQLSAYPPSSSIEITLVGTSVLCPVVAFSSDFSTAGGVALNTARDGTSSLITVGGVGIAAAANATLTLATVTVRAASGGPTTPAVVFIGNLSRSGGAEANMTGVGGVGIAYAVPLVNPALLGPSFTVSVLGTGTATINSVNVSVGAVTAAAFSGFVGHIGIAILAMPSPPGTTFSTAGLIVAPTRYFTTVTAQSCVLDGSRLSLEVNRSLLAAGAARKITTAVLGIGIAKACYLDADADVSAAGGYPVSSLCMISSGHLFQVFATNISQASTLEVIVDATTARSVVGAIGIASTAVFMDGTVTPTYYIVCTAIALPMVQISAAAGVAGGGTTLRWVGFVGAVGIAMVRTSPDAAAVVFPSIYLQTSSLNVTLVDLGSASVAVGCVGLVMNDFARSSQPQLMVTNSQIRVAAFTTAGLAIGGVGVVMAAGAVADVVSASLFAGAHVFVGALDARGSGVVGAFGALVSQHHVIRHDEHTRIDSLGRGSIHDGLWRPDRRRWGCRNLSSVPYARHLICQLLQQQCHCDEAQQPLVDVGDRGRRWNRRPGCESRPQQRPPLCGGGLRFEDCGWHRRR
jgi:hypothetical protein